MSLPTRSRQKQAQSDAIAIDTARFLAQRGKRIEVLPAFGAPLRSPIKTMRQVQDELGERAKRRKKAPDEDE